MIEYLVRLKVPLPAIIERVRKGLGENSPLENYDIVDIKIDSSNINEPTLVILFKKKDA